MWHKVAAAHASLGSRWVISSVIWLAVVGIGFKMLLDYENAPARAHASPTQWPSDSKLRLAQHGATLVLFAHPHCPCTRASLEELERIIASYHESVTPWVVFLRPTEVDQDWDETDLWKAAQSIPGVHVVSDLDGEECKRFHATTSGETFLFDERGDLLFSGGITFARGHSGDNVGRAAIESFLRGQEPACRHTSVFGCPIASAAASN